MAKPPRVFQSLVYLQGEKVVDDLWGCYGKYRMAAILYRACVYRNCFGAVFIVGLVPVTGKLRLVAYHLQRIRRVYMGFVGFVGSGCDQ